MKTIAVSIDDATLKILDALAEGSAGRSGVVREAVKQFAAARAGAEKDQSDRAVLRRNRSKLARQAAALVAEQAKP